MRGSVRVFLLAVFTSVLLTPLLSAEEVALPVDKTVGPGLGVIQHDGIQYNIITSGKFAVSIFTVDREHVRMNVVQLEEPIDCIFLAVQWGNYLPVFLPLSMGGSNSYLLGQETGYAEK